MFDWLRELFSTGAFMPHGHCYLWDPRVVWLHVVSDSLVALAYYSIPLMLVYMVRKRADLPYRWMFVMFGAFIVACGTTHAVAVWTVWHPVYWLDGCVKAGTAALSIGTAILLVPIVPKALALRSPAELETANRELKRSNDELKQFAHVVSHDLQEPLRMIRSYTQLLARKYKGKLDSDADEYIKFAVDGVTQMQGMVNDLLTYAQVGSGDQEPKTVDCEVVFHEVLASLQASIRETRAKIEHTRLPAVMGNAREIQQIFQNLVSNAIKFHGEKAPHVEVSAEQRDDEWVFTVRDNGIGIEPEHFDRIFVIFQRLHTRSAYPGTGIGLALCRKIIERRGGKIWVVSTPGNGSIFHFSIPHDEAAFP